MVVCRFYRTSFTVRTSATRRNHSTFTDSGPNASWRSFSVKVTVREIRAWTLVQCVIVTRLPLKNHRYSSSSSSSFSLLTSWQTQPCCHHFFLGCVQPSSVSIFIIDLTRCYVFLFYVSALCSVDGGIILLFRLPVRVCVCLSVHPSCRNIVNMISRKVLDRFPPNLQHCHIQ